jgi:hypothetical protein
MSKPVARYTITSGLAGCYMPGSNSGPQEYTSRKELADAIRYEIESQDWPAYLFREVCIRNLWAHIKRYGSSSAHFRIQHGAHEIAFHGLTEEEYSEQSREDE